MTTTGAKGPITTFSSLEIVDDNPDNIGSGFYTLQLTQEQIDNLPEGATQDGNLIYNTSTGELNLYSKGVWTVIDQSIDGDLIARSHATAPTPNTPGLIYYDTTENNFKVQDNNTNNTNHSETIYTTRDPKGNIVLKHYTQQSAPQPISVSNPEGLPTGGIYYSNQFHNMQANVGGNIEAIYTTAAVDGNLMVKQHTADIDKKEGLIYFNSIDKSFRACTGTNTTDWFYLGSQPKFTAMIGAGGSTVIDSVSGQLGGTANITRSIILNANPSYISNSKLFSLGGTVQAEGSGEYIKYTGKYDTTFNISTTINYAVTYTTSSHLRLYFYFQIGYVGEDGIFQEPSFVSMPAYNNNITKSSSTTEHTSNINMSIKLGPNQPYNALQLVVSYTDASTITFYYQDTSYNIIGIG